MPYVPQIRCIVYYPFSTSILLLFLFVFLLWGKDSCNIKYRWRCHLISFTEMMAWSHHSFRKFLLYRYVEEDYFYEFSKFLSCRFHQRGKKGSRCLYLYYRNINSFLVYVYLTMETVLSISKRKKFYVVLRWLNYKWLVLAKLCKSEFSPFPLKKYIKYCGYLLHGT